MLPRLPRLKKGIGSLCPLSQWALFWKTLNQKEKLLFSFWLTVFLFSTTLLFSAFYSSHTVSRAAIGGTYREGVVGQPRFINPVLASSDADRDLLELIFAGLMKYNQEGEIIPDLASEYQILEGGRIYEITLKQARWHDGVEVSADDVVFTVEKIQSIELKSPELINWLGVRVEKISDRKVRFRLQNPYLPFLERLTLKILPAHIFREISEQNLPFSEYNLKPIGAGPFRFKEIKSRPGAEIESLTLARNPDYFDGPPFLSEITLFFFPSENELVAATQKRELDGLMNLETVPAQSWGRDDLVLHRLASPRYFALFFNPRKLEISARFGVRQALNYAIDRKEILEKAVGGRGAAETSPILPAIYGFKETSGNGFNLERAEELFEKVGFKKVEGKMVRIISGEIKKITGDLRRGSRGKEVENLQRCLALFPEIYPAGTISGFFGPETEEAVIAFQEKYREEILGSWGFKEGTGIVAETTRKKLNGLCQAAQAQTTPLELKISTISQPFLVETANLLKEQWGRLGIEARVEILEPGGEIREVIKEREYEILLFGEALGAIPDPFAFWHSSRVRDPGLNLAFFENKKADQFLKDARESANRDELQRHLEGFQEIFLEDLPALILYRPDYLYWVSTKVRGVDLEMAVEPSKRFSQVNQWYLETSRVWTFGRRGGKI